MKTISSISLMAILATGVIVPALQYAYALKKADNSEKLSPKAFGEKTKDKFQSSDSTHKNGFESVKKEDAKITKKTAEQNKSQELIQKLYRKG